MAVAVLTQVPETVRGLLVEEYDFLVAAGKLDGQRVELLQGELVSVPPIGPEHASTVGRVSRALRQQVPTTHEVREQQPLSVPPSSEPEPDVAVVLVGDDPHAYDYAHPTSAVLVVEVAGSSLPTDLQVKPEVYAAAAVAEYWVVDLEARLVHLHRHRREGGYAEVTVQVGGTVVSATEPSFSLAVEDVLPRRA